MSNLLDDIIVGDIGMFGLYWPWDPKEKVQERVRKNVGMWQLFSPTNVALYAIILGTYAYLIPALRSQKKMDEYAGKAQAAVKTGAKKSVDVAKSGAKAGVTAGKLAITKGMI